MFKAILFDIGNVLVDVEEGKAVEKIAKFGSGSFKKNIKSLPLSFKAFTEFEKGFLSSHEFYTEILNKLDGEFSYEEFTDAWCGMFFPKPKIYRLLTRLKGRYRLGLLSNTNSIHLNFLKDNYDFFQLIDYECYSFELHALKPNKTIYKKAILKTGLLPEQILFIDDKKENVTAAENMGMMSLQYEFYDKLEGDLAKLNILI